MTHSSLEIAKLVNELCQEAIAQRCAKGKVTVDDLTLYADALRQCDWNVQFYVDQQQKEEQKKGETTPW